jgi:hypothetical protein
LVIALKYPVVFLRSVLLSNAVLSNCDAKRMPIKPSRAELFKVYPVSYSWNRVHFSIAFLFYTCTICLFLLHCKCVVLSLCSFTPLCLPVSYIIPWLISYCRLPLMALICFTACWKGLALSNGPLGVTTLALSPYLKVSLWNASYVYPPMTNVQRNLSRNDFFFFVIYFSVCRFVFEIMTCRTQK